MRRLVHVCSIVGVGAWLCKLITTWATVGPTPRQLAAILMGSYCLIGGSAMVLAGPRRAGVLLRFTATTLALTFALGSLELASAVGLADFRDWFVAQAVDPRRNVDNVADPELIHIHRPYLRRTGATRGDLASALHLTDSPLHPYDVAYDRNGFRNPQALSAADVVVVGDSFVEGGLVAAEDLLTATLGRLVGCTVANLGQSGYGPQQELVVLKRYAAPLRPKLCIWTFYEGNDLDDVARYEGLTRAIGRSAVGASYRERSFGRNALRAASRELGRVIAPCVTDRAACGLFRGEDGRTTRLFFPDQGMPPSRRGHDALDDVVAVMNAAHASCTEGRMSLLIVFAPGKFRVYRDYCDFPRENPCSRWALDDLPERLRAKVAAISPAIGFLDLTTALKAEAARGGLVYFADDTHWSADGHRAAGRAIAGYVAQHGDLSPPTHSPGTLNRSVTSKLSARCIPPALHAE